ncbi:SDR family NAD(P)-dependent oxidoreductase [Embleya sp. NPDC008237]|uniref:SDR family NAD(P)-dependent oxidoreductase n=1 Tax=Embleya sp. NPDC008237 TaxID=3363978 RepID=UPI0036EF3546
MNLNLKNKVVVVTGGSKGIGLAIVRGFAEEGARVVAGSRTMTPELIALRAEFDVLPVAVDLTRPDGPAELVQVALDAHGGLDVLVNNVGTGAPTPSIIEVEDTEWQRIFEINLFSAVRATKAAMPAILARSGGTVITISSLNSHLPAASLVHYSAAKAALSSYSKSLAEEFGPQGVRVNTVSPGPVRTPLWTDPGQFADMMAASAGTTAQVFMDEVLPQAMGVLTGRVSEPQEVADVVLFLASERAANIMGVDYIVDGGMHKAI